MPELIRNIERSLAAYNTQDFTAAFNFATLAVEATAQNYYKKESIKRSDFINFLRNYYWIMEPFMGLSECSAWKYYPNIKITDDRKRLIGGGLGPDLADIIYHVFRCNIHHGKAIPKNFEIIPANNAPSIQIVSIDSNNVLHLASNTIIALLAVCMACSANAGLAADSECFLYLNFNTAILMLEENTRKDTEVCLHILCTPNEKITFNFKDYFGKETLIRKIINSIPRQPDISTSVFFRKTTTLSYKIHYI